MESTAEVAATMALSPLGAPRDFGLDLVRGVPARDMRGTGTRKPWRRLAPPAPWGLEPLTATCPPGWSFPSRPNIRENRISFQPAAVEHAGLTAPVRHPCAPPPATPTPASPNGPATLFSSLRALCYHFITMIRALIFDLDSCLAAADKVGESLFAAIHIDALDEARPKGKLQAFQAIMQAHRLTPPEVLVVGDNPDSEIAAGNRLGMTTIQTLRPGVPPSPAAAHHIRTLAELKRFLG